MPIPRIRPLRAIRLRRVHTDSRRKQADFSGAVRSTPQEGNSNRVVGSLSEGGGDVARHMMTKIVGVRQTPYAATFG